MFPGNAATAALVAAGENAGATHAAAVCLDFGDNVVGNGDRFAAQVLKNINCRDTHKHRRMPTTRQTIPTLFSWNSLKITFENPGDPGWNSRNLQR